MLLKNTMFSKTKTPHFSETIHCLKTVFSLIRMVFSVVGVMAQQPVTITLQNPGEWQRTDEPICITRPMIEKFTGKIPSDKFPVFKKESGEMLPSQADDYSGDGLWDEAILLASFLPKEKLRVSVAFVKQEQVPAFTNRTHARLAKLKDGKFVPVTSETMPAGHKQTDFSTTQMPLYQTEGPIWENDKVGFRLYFDPRNGKDIFGKTSTEMVLDKVGLPGDNYHQKNGWGMDILKVGSSLGAGALALVSKDATGKPLLVRLGENVTKTTYQLVADGPVRSVIRLTYKNWQPAPNETYDVTEEITITAGQYGYESKVTLANFTGERQLATGIVNIHSENAIQKMAKGYCLLATHAIQSENKDKLGMGILIRQSDFGRFGETPKSGSEKILQTYFLTIKAKNNIPVSYQFYAGWEATDSQFSQSGYFEAFLEEEAKRLADPVKVKFNP